MDDMRLLTEMRSEVPQPDPERLALIRRRWMQRTSQVASPVRRWPAIRAASAWRLVGAAGLVVAVGTAGVNILGGGFDRSGGSAVREDAAGVEASTTPMSASHFLLLAAERVQASTADEPRPDQWVYLKMRDTGKAPADSVITERWFKMDGTLVARTLPSGQLSVGPALEGGDTSEAGPGEMLRKLQALARQREAAGDESGIVRLPTDSDALLGIVYAMADEPDRSNRDAQAFVALSGMLTIREALVPARLTALYRAMARIPGVRLDENAVDAAGRFGTGLSVATVPGQRFQVIVDPRSGGYFSQRNLALDGAVLNSAVRLGAAVVDQAGHRQ